MGVMESRYGNGFHDLLCPQPQLVLRWIVILSSPIVATYPCCIPPVKWSNGYWAMSFPSFPFTWYSHSVSRPIMAFTGSRVSPLRWVILAG